MGSRFFFCDCWQAEPESLTGCPTRLGKRAGWRLSFPGPPSPAPITIRGNPHGVYKGSRPRGAVQPMGSSPSGQVHFTAHAYRYPIPSIPIRPIPSRFAPLLMTIFALSAMQHHAKTPASEDRVCSRSALQKVRTRACKPHLDSLRESF
jgi:hypothetical protein